MFKYKIDVLQTLKETGYNTNKLRKEKLLNELKQLKNVDDVDKECCCVARMFILYLTLENMLQDANSGPMSRFSTS